MIRELHSNTVLSLIQNNTLQDNARINNVSSTSSLSYTTNLYTTTKSTLTYSNLVEALRNMPIESTTVHTPIDPCSVEGSCNFTKYIKHQFCHCDTDCYIYNDCCTDIKKPLITRMTILHFIPVARGINLTSMKDSL